MLFDLRGKVYKVSRPRRTQYGKEKDFRIPEHARNRRPRISRLKCLIIDLSCGYRPPGTSAVLE
jgi:hypothetical protein